MVINLYRHILKLEESVSYYNSSGKTKALLTPMDLNLAHIKEEVHILLAI